MCQKNFSLVKASFNIVKVHISRYSLKCYSFGSLCFPGVSYRKMPRQKFLLQLDTVFQHTSLLSSNHQYSVQHTILGLSE